MVHPYSSINTATPRKKCFFIFLVRSDFHMIRMYLSIAVHAFAKRMLMSLSVDVILLPSYVNLFTNFRDFLRRAEVTPACLKHMHFVSFAFTWTTMSPAACSWLWCKCSARTGVFARSARLWAAFFSTSHFLLFDLCMHTYIYMYGLW